MRAYSPTNWTKRVKFPGRAHFARRSTASFISIGERKSGSAFDVQAGRFGKTAFHRFPLECNSCPESKTISNHFFEWTPSRKQDVNRSFNGGINVHSTNTNIRAISLWYGTPIKLYCTYHTNIPLTIYLKV